VAYIGARFSSQKTLGKEAVLASLAMTTIRETRVRREENKDVLWREDVFGVGFDLYRGEAGGVPAAAEGFDKEDAGD
jgi:hypothetical protein